MHFSDTQYRDLPVAISVTYDMDFDKTLSSPEASAQFDAQLQQEIRFVYESEFVWGYGM